MAFTISTLTPLWEVTTEPTKRTGIAVWQLVSDTTSTPAAAEAALVVAGFGGIASKYPGEPETSTLVCNKRTSRCTDKARTVFTVTCDYDSTATAFATNPLDDPIAFDFDGENRDEPYYKDTDEENPGYAETTAGEPFAELPRRESATVLINFSFNVAQTASEATYYPHWNTINDGPLTVAGLDFEDGQVKCGPIKLSAVQDRDGQKYRTVSGQLKARPDGWDDKYESRGLFEWDDTLSCLFPIVDSTNNPTDVPWPLDADGAAKGSLEDTGAEIVLKPYKRSDLASIFPTTEA